VNLRPHAKIHKATPILAWMQLRAGAIGITASKLSEAEVLASAGIRVNQRPKPLA
jgi:D-serine deaminase-like pyridoxal phosphate-dependent protein